MKMSTRFRKTYAETVGFVRKERVRLGFLLVSVLIGIIGFEVGLIRGSMGSSAPLVIEKPVGELVTAECPVATVAGVTTESAGNGDLAGPSATPGSAECRFIGSKNSDLYHTPGCGPANRIKEENIVCFPDVAAATARGYEPGCVR
jgi:hypothetical protein